MKTSLYSARSFVFFALLASACASAETVRRERRVEYGPQGTESTQEVLMINDEQISILTETWSADTLEAQGVAPIVSRYDDPTRDRLLAREAAIVQAKVALAAMIGEEEVRQDVTVNDLAANQVAQTRLRAVLQGAFVILERENELNNTYEVTVGLPKIRLLEIVEEFRR